MHAQFSADVLHRYRAIAELADRGDGGEQDTARRLLARMKTQNPGIHQAAFPPEPLPQGPMDPGHPIWTDLAARFRDTVAWATQAAYEAAQLEEARLQAEDVVEVKTRILKSGRWQVAARINLDDLDDCANALSAIQQEVFIETVLEAVRESLREALTMSGDE
jgi:hypothetical protein